MPPARRAVAAPQRLQFIFTKNSFRIDHPEWALEEPEERLKKQFQQNRGKALFLLGFSDAPGPESASLGFLRLVSTEFMRALTALPELEIARENTEVGISAELSQKLLDSVPYCTWSQCICGHCAWNHCAKKGWI